MYIYHNCYFPLTVVQIPLYDFLQDYALSVSSKIFYTFVSKQLFTRTRLTHYIIESKKVE